MKYLAICCLVLALAAFTVPSTYAAQKCIHFTNFCDSIEYEAMSVGGETGKLYIGSWDWECLGSDYDTSVIAPKGIESDNGTKLAFATRPVDKPSNTPFAYTTMFIFNTADHMFDLWATSGDADDGGVTFAFQTNQPYTVTNGSCGYLRTQHSNLPRATNR